MSLIELLVGPAVGSIVAAGAMAGAAAGAAQVRSVLASMRIEGGPAEALDAMLADVRGDPAWLACRVAACPGGLGRSHGIALVAGGHAWAVHNGRLRICWHSHCEVALRGVSAMQVFVDRHDGGRVHRVEAPDGAVGAPRRVEIRLWLADGTPRSRSTWIAP